jgi:hypothetical protein
MAGINMNAAAPGLGRLAAALAGGKGSGSAYDQGMQGEIGLQSKLAQAMATTRLNNLKADAEAEEAERRTPEAVRRIAMVGAGVPLDDEGAVDSYFRTGSLGGKYQLPQGLQGPTVPTPEYLNPDNLSRVASSITGVQRALTVGEKNVENIAKANSIERGDRLSDSIIAGRANRNVVGGAQAAAAGKDLFHADSTGAVLDRFAGGLDTNNPMAGATINLRDQQAGQAKAGAAENYAQADNARATAAKTRDETGRAKAGEIVQVTRPDGSVWLVNKMNGLSRPVVDADGNAVTSAGKGHSNGAGGKPMTEGQAKANLFGGRMLESDSILSKLEDEGVSNTGIVKGIVQGTAGMVPLVGDKLSEAAGSGMNVLPGALGGPSSKQQQVDQARRDFLNAVLRRESGASIAQSEFMNAEKQYFPQPGDSSEVKAQKRRNRQLAVQLMLQEVPDGQRYKPRGTAPNTPPPAGGAAAPEGSWGGTAPAGRNVKVDY